MAIRLEWWRRFIVKCEIAFRSHASNASLSLEPARLAWLASDALDGADAGQSEVAAMDTETMAARPAECPGPDSSPGWPTERMVTQVKVLTRQ